MRPPRYRFPDEVRTQTRAMADRMVREGTVTRTPEELESWIAGTPEVREALESGGYGTAFTADDLFPLLEVFVAQAAGSSRPAAPTRASMRLWIPGLVLAALLLILLFALAT
jgi:hypothetical protein